MNVSEDLIRKIVEQVLSEANADGMKRTIDPSGVIGIKTSTVKCEPFDGRKGVRLMDVTSVEEAPRMGAGVMELDHDELPWTLVYDEFDIVLEGTLWIEVDGRITEAKAGDMIYIPKNTSVIFKTPDYTRYAYTVYPANWADLCK